MAADPKKAKAKAKEVDRDEDAEGEDQAADEGKKKKKKLFIMIGIGVLLMVFSIGGTLLTVKLLSSDSKKDSTEKSVDDEEDEDENEEDEEEVEVKAAPAIYYTMEPNFTVNFSVEGRQRYLQAEITLMYRNAEVDSLLKLHMPAIRNQLVMLLSTKSFDELQNPDSREKLKVEALQAIQSILDKENAALKHKNKTDDEEEDEQEEDEEDSEEVEKEDPLVIEQVLFTRFVMQ
jgi:flagellar FliL protein